MRPLRDFLVPLRALLLLRLAERLRPPTEGVEVEVFVEVFVEVLELNKFFKPRDSETVAIIPFLLLGAAGVFI